MIKILSGMVAAIVIAVGGFFGFQFYTQRQIANGIEATLEQVRSAGGKASHGKISFDLLSRTVTIADLTAQSAAQPPVSIKIASLTASRAKQPDPAHLSAETIDINDVEISAAMGEQAALSLTYKVPKITVKDYSGPASLQRPPASSSFVDVYRSALQQFAGVTASLITAPTVTATMNQGVAAAGGGEVAYTGLTVQGVKDGKIASTRIENVKFTVNTQPAGKPDKLTGDLANIIANDIDTTGLAAVFDPQKANDDQYYRAYRQITAGAYVITSGQGLKMRIDGMTIDDLGLRPARMQLPELLALIPPTGAQPTPAQARALIEKVAKVYEGIRIGNAEMRGFAVETPEGPVKLSAMRFNLDGGKINEFAIEGVDGRTPQGPLKVGRFALKSLDIAGLLRISAQFSNAAQPPSPDQALGMLSLIEGVELKGLSAPFKDTGKQVSIDAFNLDWSQFIGPIPSKIRLGLKMAAPLDARDPGQKALVTAGLDKVTLDLDLGTAWTEASRLYAFEPVKLSLGGVAKASARVFLANVPRGAFTPNPVQAAAMAGKIEIGIVELTLNDSGGIDLLVTQQARAQNLNRAAARRAIVDDIWSATSEATRSNRDLEAAVGAITRFVERPGQTLNIRLTPLDKVTTAQLMELLKTDPLVALEKFRVEASTGL